MSDTTKRSNCEGCDLEFDESELDDEGLCKECAEEFAGIEDDLEDPDLEP